MKINAAGINVNSYKPVFKSIRTDKLTVKQLKDGEVPILENNKQNIYKALNNLSVQSDRKNIEFLIDIASNLSYGQGSNDSEFSKILDSEGITSSERENTNWSEILNDTILRALDSSVEDVSALETEWKTINENNKKLTPDQEKLLDLRKEFTDKIINDSTLDDAESLAMTTRVRKNLDYFIASSEIPAKQKEECLEKLVYFMSDDYKITPQLKDKKLQAVDEMLNDMIIKTPEDEILTIKEVNQRQTGMCAAISICRKLMAYEDKTRFVELIMDELEDSPSMSVYDITELGSGKKVNIPKTELDYNTALERGYRIIDASAHNWMQNAHASGDGTIQTEHYVPFDEENYGIYDDSSWYLGLDESQTAYKNHLKALIKENELLKSFNMLKKQTENVNQNINGTKKKTYETQKSALGKLNSTFIDVFPEKSASEITQLENDLIDYYTGINNDNEINVGKKLPAEIKEKILLDYILKRNPDITEEQETKIKNKSHSIYLMTDEYSSADSALKKLTKYSSMKNKYRYNKKLYNLAAAHRIAVEEDINMPDGVVRFERSSGLPTRDIQITNYMKSLKASFSSPAVRNKYANEEGIVPTKKELEDEINSDLIKMEVTIPKELNSIVKTLSGQTMEEIASSSFKKLSEKIENREANVLENTKSIMGLKGDRNEVAAQLNKWSDKLSSSPSQKDVSEAIRLLGYENNMQFCYNLMKYTFASLQEGISEEEFNLLAKNLGGKDKIVIGLQSQQNKYNELVQEYSRIINKWNVPTARTNILSKLEKEHCIISRSKLDILKDKFRSTSSKLIKNENIQNIKERQKEDNKLYEFSNVENEIFENIEKTLPYMKKYSKLAYKEVNDILSDSLEKQYANIGMLNGQFWVREEGSSGLTVNEQIRIIEQMTGKPYHAEYDINKAAEEVKEGAGSGTISTSVDDNDYAFHAQYVPSVTSETFINPITDEKTTKDVLWTDNSWGKIEKEHFWNGQNGFLYTDYGSGYGWKDGFILNDDYRIGLPVEDIFGAVGYAKEDNEQFSLFSDMILPGTPADTYQKLYKMFNYIFSIGSCDKLYSKMEKQLQNGSKLNIKQLEGLDNIVEAKSKILEKRLDNEIKTKEDFDKLPENDELKFIFKQISVFFSTDNQNLAESVISAQNEDDLKEAIDLIEEEHINQISAIAAKSDAAIEYLEQLSEAEFEKLFDRLEKEHNCRISDEKKERLLDDIFYDEKSIKKLDGKISNLEDHFLKQVKKVARKNILRKEPRDFFIKNAQDIIQEQIDKNLKIKSLDSPVISNSPLGSEFIKAVDKYLQPKSDEELLQIIQGLQMADYETASAFFDVLKPEDIGIEIKEPWYYLKLYKAFDSKVNKAFSNIVASREIYPMLNNSEDDEEDTPEEIYRALYIKLAEIDVQKFIKSFKAEAFQKYKVRQAFPQPVVFSDELLAEHTFKMLSLIKDSSDKIQSYDLYLNIFSKYNDIKYNFSNEDFYQDLLNNTDVKITDNNRENINKFKQSLQALYDALIQEESFKDDTIKIKNLISILNKSKSCIDGEAAGSYLKEIMSTVDELENNGVDRNKLIQIKKEEINTINENIKFIVNSNIEPKYRNDAAKLIYEFVNLSKNGASDEELLLKQADITEMFINRHITKNPTLLYKECVQLLMDGKSSSVEYKTMRNYLKDIFRIAEQTKIQYKMVQNQHEGISSKIKELLPLFHVTDSDGKEEQMNSEMGMIYLVKALENNGDNYKTLNLFLEQSGLSKQALKALINNTEFDKINNEIKQQTDKIQNDFIYLDNLADVIFQYQMMEKMPFKELKTSIKSMSGFIKGRLRNYKDIELYSKFIEYLDSYLNEKEIKHYNLTPDMIETITNEFAGEALQYANNLLNEQNLYLKDFLELLDNRIQLVNSIKVPVDSEEYDLRCNFLHEYAQLQANFEKINDEINTTLKNTKYLSSESSEI